jgi:hypothetical protein
MFEEIDLMIECWQSWARLCVLQTQIEYMNYMQMLTFCFQPGDCGRLSCMRAV